MKNLPSHYRKQGSPVIPYPMHSSRLAVSLEIDSLQMKYYQLQEYAESLEQENLLLKRRLETLRNKNTR